jgi:hypothetical protein
MPDLQPNGTPVRAGRSTLRTPGLAGSVTAHAPGSPGMRSAERATGELEEALAAQHLQTFETIEIIGAREAPTGAAVTRSAAYGQPAMELSVPDPGPDWGQVVLAVDEAGVATWHLARDASGAVDTTRGSGDRTYLIPRRVVPPAHDADTRGLIGFAGRKVLKVLVFPLLDPVAEQVGEQLALRWERSQRPYRLRAFTPDDYQGADTTLIADGDWARLAGGPALLLVHGTFSRAHSAFGDMPPDFVEWLHHRYQGRVFAFDHHTLSASPQQNIEWLLEAIPADLALDLDIICHSRGGLVSRLLTERPDALNAQRLRVRRSVFLAAPNAGTVLADPEHFGDLVDTVTNVLNCFPDNGATDILGAVITVVKQLAVGALGGLDGLGSMQPGGPFLAELNATPITDTEYFAIAADFEPPPGSGFAAYAKNLVHDLIFGTANDLVVPTDGVWDVENSANFPITERHVFHSEHGVAHSSITRHPMAVEQIRTWLEPEFVASRNG